MCQTSLVADMYCDAALASSGTDTIDRATAADLGAVVALLQAAGLPVDDVAEHFASFLLARRAQTLVGCVGFERYGDVALLRSLCIAESHRGGGVGHALLERALHAAGARDVYLLTTTAAGYFEQRGFEVLPRERVPLAIASTAEFRSLCPASATVMHCRINR